VVAGDWRLAERTPVCRLTVRRRPGRGREAGQRLQRCALELQLGARRRNSARSKLHTSITVRAQIGSGSVASRTTCALAPSTLVSFARAAQHAFFAQSSSERYLSAAPARRRRGALDARPFASVAAGLPAAGEQTRPAELNTRVCACSLAGHCALVTEYLLIEMPRQYRISLLKLE